jgi:hypothetical protein
MADYGHLLWLKFGILGITIRPCIFALAVAVAFGLNFKRFRQDPVRGRKAFGIAY